MDLDSRADNVVTQPITTGPKHFAITLFAVGLALHLFFLLLPSLLSVSLWFKKHLEGDAAIGAVAGGIVGVEVGAEVLHRGHEGGRRRVA